MKEIFSIAFFHVISMHIQFLIYLLLVDFFSAAIFVLFKCRRALQIKCIQAFNQCKCKSQNNNRY